MKSKKNWIIGAVVALGILGVLVYTGVIKIAGITPADKMGTAPAAPPANPPVTI